ncbi:MULTISPECIES: glycosyltransferase [unclassified Empedobacter]|uniref:glycosyltransferase n=1 Tax=unclassified Empedobacter TaxID=2643773 RepID=UPI0025C5489A|nr:MULTISPECIES: glycosyltransferase [unclassified Empedobacter]
MNKNLLIIPHYNNPDGLIKSISSIGKDENLDVIVIDDGSSINKINEFEVLSNKAFKGEILFKYCNVNRGIEFVLNDAINYALGKDYIYLSRLDCGDICKNNRFQTQELFFEKNKSISLIGSNVDAVNENGDFLYTIKVPLTDKDIRKGMLINCMFIHPSVMFKTEVIKQVGKYPTEYKAAEDFALFTNILKYFKGANINESLVTIELNTKGISITNRKKQTKSRIQILEKNYKLGITSTYGLIRSYILHYTPYSLVQKLKNFIYK